MSGFTTGAAMSIGLSQLKNAFGFLTPKPLIVPQQGACVSVWLTLLSFHPFLCLLVSYLLCFFIFTCLLLSLSVLLSPFSLTFLLSLSLSLSLRPSRMYTNPYLWMFLFLLPYLGMHGFENNYNVMDWYLNNWNGQITAAQSKTNAGRYYTNHFAIAVSPPFNCHSSHLISPHYHHLNLKIVDPSNNYHFFTITIFLMLNSILNWQLTWLSFYQICTDFRGSVRTIDHDFNFEAEH